MKRCALWCSLSLMLAACGPEVELEVGATLPRVGANRSTLWSEDQLETVDIGSWNVEWFAQSGLGPADDFLQQSNVYQVIRQIDLDLLGLVEVVNVDAYRRLVRQLPNHSGILVTDTRVSGGNLYYTQGEQKVALLYKSRFRVTSARVILTTEARLFGGRPPMEVRLALTENGLEHTMIVIVAHFKAMSDLDGYTRRNGASQALKTYLDLHYPDRWVIVIGDFNDDIDVSTYKKQPSPFQNFVFDSGRYRFTTDALTAMNVSTTTNYKSTIDHHLATDELDRRYVAGSAKVVRPDLLISDFANTTSDHYPVITRYDLR